MKTKRFLSVFFAIILCLSSITVYANKAEAVDTEASDNPAEALVVTNEGYRDKGLDYSDMLNWAYWNEG